MRIYLSWENLNTSAVKLEIYRGDAPLDRANLPATPIVTLTNGETSYIDEDGILLGKTYYYVFVTSNAGDRQVSDNQTVTAVSRRGPGSQILQQGDNTLGYFGMMTAGELISGTALASAVGLSAATATNFVVYRSAPNWYKYVRNNKIIYVPEGPIGTGVTWTQLYSLGLVFGSDDNGVSATPPNPLVLQNKKVTIGRDVFRVRLMRTWFDQPSADAPVAGNKAPYPEYDDLVTPIYHQVTPNQRLNNFYLNGRYYWADFSLNGLTNSMNLCMEPLNANNLTGRGPYGTAASLNEETTPAASSNSTLYSGPYSNTALGNWYPVLELIEG